jgi:hypothetical protein
MPRREDFAERKSSDTLAMKKKQSPLVDAAPEQGASGERCSVAAGSAGWWLTGWQRLWRKSPNDEHHEIRIYRKLQAAEDRYQRENKMGRYSLPNGSDHPRDQSP